MNAHRFETNQLVRGMEACLQANLELVTTQLDQELVLTEIVVKLLSVIGRVETCRRADATKRNTDFRVCAPNQAASCLFHACTRAARPNSALARTGKNACVTADTGYSAAYSRAIGPM